MTEILVIPDQKLREVCAKVEEIDEGIQDLANDLFDTVLEHEGAGLSANQIGALRRVVAINAEEFEEPLIVINPEFAPDEYFGQMDSLEGCLSIPGVLATVKRYISGTLTGLDRDGKEISMSAIGPIAVIAQHEIDHLDGILMTDRAHKMRRVEAMQE